MNSAWISETRNAVERLLGAYFERKRADATTLAQDALELVEAVESLTMRGGKRLRAAAVKAGAAVVEKASVPEPAIIAAGASMELLQAFLLIHDDWMDQDDQRRGGPAIHALLRERHQDAHLGASLAVLSGDLAGAYAWEMLMDALAALPSDQATLARSTHTQRVFLRMHEEVFFGQHLDLTHAADVDRMHDLKTGSYTVGGPLRLGAALAGGDTGVLEALSALASPLGLAFQLRDDLLGTFGDADAMGKPTGNDLRAGKLNAVVREAQRRLPAADWKRLEGILGAAKASDAAVSDAISMLEAHGIREAVEKQATENLARAQACIDDGPFTDAGRAYLRAFADAIVNRAI